MAEEPLHQKREELRLFKGTRLYADLMKTVAENRARLLLNLVRAALRSHDPAVRGIAESFRADSTFESEIRAIEAPDNIESTPRGPEDEKFYRDYTVPLDANLQTEQEY